MNEQEFPQGSVPVAVAARVYGKDASWVRAGIVSGWLPIGKATRSGKLVTTIEEMDSRYNIKAQEIEETVTDDKGKEKKVKQNVNVADENWDGSDYGPYHRDLSQVYHQEKQRPHD